MKAFKLNLILFCFFIKITAFSQIEKRFLYFQAVQLNVGYNYAYYYNDEQNTGFHMLDIGVNKARYGGRHGGGIQYGFGTEIGTIQKRIIAGPKNQCNYLPRWNNFGSRSN